MAKQISIMDTTLRDGEQTQGVSFSPDEKVNLAMALLSKLRVDRIEVASARVSDGEQAGVARINEWAAAEQLDQRVDGQVQRFFVQAAEALVDEDRVQHHAARIGLNHVRQAQRQ